MGYVSWLVVFVFLPLGVLWSFDYKLFWRYRRTVAACIFWALVFSVPWDIWAVRAEVWYFPDQGNLGILLGGLPLEEYLFIVFVTLLVCCLTLSIKKRMGKRA